jgi:hypothetical protein
MASRKSPAARKPKPRPPVIFAAPEPLRLDLGSGPRPREGFEGVDVVPGVARHCFDLSSAAPWPFPENSVDELHSSHFLEHLDAAYHRGVEGYPGGRVDVLYRFFDEAFRVAKPGATFTCQWPALQSVRAFQDPTHRRFVPAEMIGYLSVEGRKALGQEHLGIRCNWIGTVTPTIPIPPETEEDKAMALRADSSDAKQAWLQKRHAEQMRRYVESWNYSCDFVAVLKAVK